MTNQRTAGRCTITTRDIGKPVVTCCGESIGRIEGVDGAGSFTLSLEPEGVSYLQLADDSSNIPVVTFPPEMAEFVAQERVWLRI